MTAPAKITVGQRVLDANNPKTMYKVVQIDWSKGATPYGVNKHTGGWIAEEWKARADLELDLSKWVM